MLGGDVRGRTEVAGRPRQAANTRVGPCVAQRVERECGRPAEGSVNSAERMDGERGPQALLKKEMRRRAWEADVRGEDIVVERPADRPRCLDNRTGRRDSQGDLAKHHAIVTVGPMVALATQALLLQSEDRIEPKCLCAEGFVRHGLEDAPP